MAVLLAVPPLVNGPIGSDGAAEEHEVSMARRIAMATIGTQGDVQPYVAVALELQARGHEVVLGAPDDFADFVKGYGIAFASLGSNIQEFISQSSFQNAMSRSALLNAPTLLAEGQRIVDTATRAAWEMSQGADGLLLNMNTSFGVDIAEALGIPAIMAAPQPLNTTSEFPLCAYSGPSLGSLFNRLSYRAMSVQQLYYNLPRNRLRREVMGLPPRRHGGFFRDTDGSPLTTLYSYSAHVAPRPADWPDSAIITGYWRLEDRTGWAPSPEFEAFLAAGPRPVYIGFGSMPFGAERNTEILREAVALWGGRAVVARGWGGINPDHLPGDIFAIEKAPHDKLFAHVAAVVHHGGAGTTSAGLYLGRPTFVVPQTVDQPFWGRRVHALGCGPEPVRLRKLTPEVLARALEDLSTNGDYAKAAAAVAAKLNAENGPARAAEIIEARIAEGRRGPVRASR
ncbi:glycosyltransferase [Arsenicitalea aurantiaca]|uniref:Glycosyltransferase n=1 Tax=Arsenicitalea aurantiaca TaxID=1783274 RepID=A0A433XEP2_9HYPH|nr:glycosyltransferase [Arsenicitalea aurantiaca]RUT32565.1 glycosyltransferase [Arsenicitalea aurantiaca]